MGKENSFQPNTLPLKVRTPGIKLVSDQLIAALAEQHVINIRVRGFFVIGCFWSKLSYKLNLKVIGIQK